jgi:adenylate cyclase
MHDIDRLRRAGGGALRLLVDLLPGDLGERTPGDVATEVCVVFADVADYSDAVAAEGDDAAIAVLRLLDDVVDGALRTRAGVRVVKRLGDGLMLATAEPAEALAVAVDLVEGFAAGNGALPVPLALRAGVHRGTARRRDGDYVGYHVNLTARVTAAAEPGRALSTAHALAGVDLDRLGLRASSVGSLHAKGVSRPMSLFALTRLEGSDPAPARQPTLRRRARVPGLPVLGGVLREQPRRAG